LATESHGQVDGVSQANMPQWYHGGISLGKDRPQHVRRIID
jgi:hypothetical protein